MRTCSSRHPCGRSAAAVLLSIILAANGSGALFAQLSWRSPSGVVYQIAPEYVDAFMGIGTPTEKEIFAKASETVKERFSKLKTIELNNPAEWARLQAALDAARDRLQLAGDPKVSAEVVLSLEAEEGGKKGGTGWDGKPRMRIAADVIDNVLLLELTMVHEGEHVKQLNELNRNFTEAERADLEVRAYEKQIEHARRLGAPPEWIADYEYKRDIWRNLRDNSAAGPKPPGRASSGSAEWASGEYFGRRMLPQPPTAAPGGEVIQPVEPPAMPGPAEASPPEPPPGPVNPDLEKRIEDFLKGKDLGKLREDLNAGSYEFFKDPMFNPSENPAETARAWKKVCSKPLFGQHGLVLGQMRWNAIVDLWAEIARDHQVRIELIDSGKRNAYRSDVDITIYSPPESRGGKTIASLIADFTQRFEALYGYHPQNVNLTLHDGDVFIPDFRSRGQSFEEYRSSMREAVRKMRLKVTSGGDAYYVPGANLETVQKRALIEGRVTTLDPKLAGGPPQPAGGQPGAAAEATPLRKPMPVESPVSMLDPNAGKWKVNSTRFTGIAPVYDRGNSFGILMQNLLQVVEQGNDPALASKYFNLALNKGAGAGLVNSYMDLCSLPDEPISSARFPGAPGDEVIRDAMLWEANTEKSPAERRTFIGPQRQFLYGNTRTMETSFLKTRWIIRAFGYDIAKYRARPDMVSDSIRKVYELLEVSAEIEKAQIRGELDWKHPDHGRSVFLRRYFERANEYVKRTRPDLQGGFSTVDAELDATYAEAWRMHCMELREQLSNLIAHNFKKTIGDLTPAGMARNSLRFSIDPNGIVMADTNEVAARKIAERLRVELALSSEIINKLPAASRIDLLGEISRNTPPDLKPEVQKLLNLSRAELDHFLSEFEPKGGSPGADGSGTPEGPSRDTALAEKLTRVERVAEVSAQEAERSLQSQENSRRLREHIVRGATVRDPASGSAIKGMIISIDASLRSTPRDFVSETWSNVSPLMLSSSAVNLLRAYQSGDPMAFKETLITESLFYLPPVYGVAGIAIKDFSRGKFAEGLHSIGMLGLIHLGSKYLVPGLGDFLLIYSVGTGVPQLAHSYIVHKIEDDLIEQAFRSRPDPSAASSGIGAVRAQRNPFRDSVLIKADPPAFPILYNNACVKAEDHDTPLSDLIVKARRLYAPVIWKELIGSGLTPASADWESEWDSRAKKYAFDLPYAQRMEKLYDCFWRQVADETKPDGSNESEALQKVFGNVVRDWFNSQPEPYRDEYTTILGSTAPRDRLLDALTNRLIGMYFVSEAASEKRDEEKKKIEDLIKERVRQWNIAEMRLILTKDRALERIQAGFNSFVARQLSGQQPVTASVRLDAPSWYLDMSGFVFNEPADQTAGRQEEAANPSEPGIQVGEFQGGIPVDLFVDANRADFPQPWKHDYVLKLEKIERQPPQGWQPNEDEKKKLDEKDELGQPKNTVFAITLSAEASAYDSDGKLIGEAPPVPIVGYAIEPIPHVSGSAAVVITALRPVTPDRKVPEAVICKVKLDGKIEHDSMAPPLPPPLTQAFFGGLREGAHSLTITPVSQDWEPTTAGFDVADPYTSQAYGAGSPAPPQKFPIVVNVELKYKGKMPENPTETAQQQGNANLPPPPSTATTGPGGTKPDPKVVEECEGLAERAQKMVANGNLNQATKDLAELQKKCKDLTPGVNTLLNEALRLLREAIEQIVGDIKASMQRCEFEAALNFARELEQFDPGNAWLASNLPALERDADAQKRARDVLRPAKGLIESKDLKGAIPLLLQAEAIAPLCMKNQIQPLRVELERRVLFADLSKQAAEAANTACDFKAAQTAIDQIKAITPQDAWITEWLSENAAKIPDLQRREQEAVRLIAQAQAAANAAKKPEEWDAVITTLEQAADVAPNCVRKKLSIDQLIADAKRRKQPVEPDSSMVLLIDTSGSMADNGKIDQAKNAARVQARRASQTIEMAILAFDGGCSAGSVRVVHDFSPDANSLMSAIDNLRPGGGTPMYIAVGVAVDYAQKKGRGKQRLVVLMSDGGDTCRSTMAAAADAVRTSNIPVNTIGFDVGKNKQAQEDLRNLANITRGVNLSASSQDPKELLRAFDWATMPSMIKPLETMLPPGTATAVQSHFASGKAMVQQRDLPGALSQFQQAHQLAPDSPALNFNLSLLYEAQDQLMPAIQHAQRYVELAPEAFDRGDVQNRIANLQADLKRNPRAIMDPAACRDIYEWARKEQSAKRGNVARRQAILEILVAAQKGDCEKARALHGTFTRNFQ